MKRWEYAALGLVLICAIATITWQATKQIEPRIPDDQFACQRAMVMLRPAAARSVMAVKVLDDKGQKVIHLAWTVDGMNEHGWCRFQRGTVLQWMDEVLLYAPGADPKRQRILLTGDSLDLLRINGKLALAVAERPR